jgi:hypothetical protein
MATFLHTGTQRKIITALVLCLFHMLPAQVISPKKIMERCNKTKGLRDQYKKFVLPPYVIEGCASKAILCGEPNQDAVIPISVLGKQRYRMYFRDEGFEGKVFVRVVTLNKKEVFNNETDSTQTMFAFTAPRTDKYFVEFNYKQSANPDAVGCVSVVLATREF